MYGTGIEQEVSLPLKSVLPIRNEPGFLKCLSHNSRIYVTRIFARSSTVEIIIQLEFKEIKKKLLSINGITTGGRVAS